jgi:hypothetical protein
MTWSPVSTFLIDDGCVSEPHAGYGAQHKLTVRIREDANGEKVL